MDRTPSLSHDYSRGSAYTFDFSEGVVHADVLNDVSDASDAEVVRIAKGIFTAEIADLIVVLRYCGALRTKVEYFWCVKELWRLLRSSE